MKARLTREAHKELATTGKAPIYLRLTHDYKVAYVATGVYLLAVEWNQKSQSVIGREEVHDEARSVLRVWVGDAEKLSQQHRKTAGMSVSKYKDLLLGREDRAMTLLAVADAFYQNKARPEMRKAFATLRLYRTRRVVLETYLTHGKMLQLAMNAVDLAWLRRFERWCISTQHYAPSTTRKYIGFVQELADFAAHETWIPLNPVVKYVYESDLPANDPAFLPEAEVQALVSVDLPTALDRARGAWLFCCFTGLSFVDYARFQPSDISMDAAGRRWIRMTRQKTGVAVSIPVLPEIQALLTRYGGTAPRVDTSSLRRRMRTVADQLGLSMAPTPALARHTASHRLRNLYGFTDEEAAAILGHSKDVMNKHYSRKREDGLSLALDRLGLVQPPPAPTLRQQLEAALALATCPELREKLLGMLKDLPD